MQPIKWKARRAAFDPVKYKRYEGSLLKINFFSKVYSKGLLKGFA